MVFVRYSIMIMVHVHVNVRLAALLIACRFGAP